MIREKRVRDFNKFMRSGGSLLTQRNERWVVILQQIFIAAWAEKYRFIAG
jgi:hypothetical protein